MGSGTSHSVVLAPHCARATGGGGASPYSHFRSQNRVLPKPVVGQRLRSTNNGRQLQSAGTLRGARAPWNSDVDSVTPRGRYEKNEKENDHGGRLFHSDPDIARLEGKYRKKARAPQPPESQRRRLERKSASRVSQRCKCTWKTKAPQPPSDVIYPPPPPPIGPFSQKTSREVVARNEHAAAKSRENGISPSWHCSAGDEGRTTVFESRALLEKRDTSHLPQKPDPFQREIHEVTCKIAESRPPPSSAPKSPPKFYFSDPSVFRAFPGTKGNDRMAGHSEERTSALINPQKGSADNSASPPLRRCPGQATASGKDKRREDLTERLPFRGHEATESRIEIKLRPVLPRHTNEVPTAFSGTGAPRSSPDACSSLSSSDGGPGKNRRKPSNFAFWTPRQDLPDDSCSDDGEEVVSPRAASSSDFSTRFSLPMRPMFSNVRPIGTQSAHSSYAKKKMAVGPESAGSTNHFRRFLSRRDNRFVSQEDVSTHSNWTFGHQNGLQRSGKLYSSEAALSERNRDAFDLSDFLRDVVASKANQVRLQLRSSESGHSNFSFYSTEGQIAARGRTSPQGSYAVPQSCWSSRTDFSHFPKKKKPHADRDSHVARLLEHEARRRRNREKVSIRQQLRMLLNSEDDDDDEAYFTREESPFFSATTQGGSNSGRETPVARGVTAVDSSPLSHWQSSPALLEDSRSAAQPSTRGRLSLCSVASDSGAWLGSREGRESSREGDVSSSPSPAHIGKKERRVYRELMDIVRREELLQKNGRGGVVDSSYSESSSGSDSSGVRCVSRSAPFASLLQPYSPASKGYRPVPFQPHRFLEERKPETHPVGGTLQKNKTR